MRLSHHGIAATAERGPTLFSSHLVPRLHGQMVYLLDQLRRQELHVVRKPLPAVLRWIKPPIAMPQ